MSKIYPVITISREFASGGHSVGLKVAEALGIPFYDKEIVTKVSEESGFSEEFVATKGEYVKGTEKFMNNFLLSNTVGYYENPQDAIFNAQRRFILEAAKEPCVIVGRCADYILKKEGVDILTVFIHSDVSHRVQHIEENYGKTGVDAQKRLKNMDKQRKAYYKYYTDIEWGDYKNYYLNLNSGYLGEDECVRMICETAKNHMIDN